MRKTIYIKPRQSGKNSQVVNLVKRTKGHILILCPSTEYSEIYKREFRDESRVTITYPTNKLNELICGRKFEFVIVDEFMHYRDSIHKSIYEGITTNAHNIKNLYMIGTPNTKVKKDLFDAIKEIKSFYRYLASREYIISKHKECTISQFDYWWNSFMTDSDANIVKDDFYYSEYTKDELIGQHGIEAYNLLYGNELWVD